MSSLYIDTEVHVVEILLNKKDGTGTTLVRAGLDFWEADKIFSGSLPVYPILAAPPRIDRSFGLAAANRHDTGIDLYAKASISRHGKAFADYLFDHEFVGSQVTIYYYPKPRDAALSAAVDAHTRIVKRVIGYAQDDVSGTMTLQTRDFWFVNKEISKKLSAEDFPDIDPAWDGEYGAKVFGGLVGNDGIVVNAPVTESAVDGSNRPFAHIFSGFTGASHPNHERKGVFVRNQVKKLETRDWLGLTLAANAQTKFTGNAGFSDLALPFLQALSTNDVMMVHQPPTNQILTAVRSSLRPLSKRWGVYFTGLGGDLLSNGTTSQWQPSESNDQSISIGGWIYLSSKSATQTIACTRAGTGTNQRSWELYYDVGADRIRFRAYKSDGTTLETISSTTIGSPSTNTWYFVACAIDHGSTRIRIRANAGAWENQSYAGTPAESKAGLRFGACRSGSSLIQPFAGRLGPMFFFESVMTDAQYTEYRNSGSGKFYYELDDTLKEGLAAYWDMDDVIIKECKDQHGSNDLKITGVPTPIEGPITATVTKDDGELLLEVYFVEQNATTLAWEPVGSAIRTATLDISDSGIQAGSTVPYFQILPALPLSAEEHYGYVISWSNKRDHSRTMLFNWRVASGNVMCVKRSWGKEDNGWKVLSGAELDMELFMVGEGVEAWEDGNGNHSYQYLEAKSITLTSGQTHQEFTDGLEFKMGLVGMEDDGSGTYTGGAGSPIDNPSDLVRFILSESDVGTDVASGRIDSTEFGTVKTYQAASSLLVGFAVDYQASIEEIIVDICRQTRMIFYQTRAGKLALHYPVYVGAGWTTLLNEAVLRADLTLLAVGDDEDSNVVNYFRQLYAPDFLNVPKDAAFLRKAETDKYTGYEFTNGSDSSSGDLRREQLCAASEVLHGRREMREPLDMFDSATKARRTHQYYVDRFTKKQKLAVVRVPRKRYYGNADLDLFGKPHITHTGLQAQNGTGFGLKSYASNSLGVSYAEGVPGMFWAGGDLAGEVIAVSEEGPFMTVTIQTESPYAS
jgi:hypothetical protein